MDRTNKGKFWTARYAIICATYYAAFCGVHMYASVFLLANGFNNKEIGIILALANISSVIILPVIAGIIDKQGRFTNRNVSAFSTILMIVFSALLFVIRDSRAIIFIIYILIYMIQMTYQSLIIAMNFEYTSKGISINFGLARGLGSAGFAVFSTIMGNVISKHGIYSLQIADILMLLCGLLFIVTFTIPKKINVEQDAGSEEVLNHTNSLKSEHQIDLVAHNNFFDFIRYYPKFSVLLVAIICFFFLHNMSNDYLFQIITPIGGTQKELGYAISLAAILELPTMSFFAKMTEKIDCGKLFKFSAAFFLIKGIVLLFSTNIIGVYISSACQMFAYAMFIPASAYYANKVMEELDQVKGQAYINCSITIGGVFSSLIGGAVLDAFGAKYMMLLGVFVCLIGTALGMVVIQNVNHLLNGHEAYKIS